MLSAVDAPKSKSISIAFIALKAMILGLVITSRAKHLDRENTEELNGTIAFIQIFFIFGLILDVLFLAYFYLTREFSRLEYYVFYGFHIILTAVTFFLGLSTIKRLNSHGSIALNVIGSVLCINLVFICSSFVMMMFNLYFILKFAHFGSNLVWTFMWISGSQCHHLIISLVGLIHGLLSVFGLFSFVVMNLMKKTSITSRCWKQFYIISLALMLICYVLILLAVPLTNNSCSETKLFVGSYQIYGLFQFFSPLLILLFLNTEMGDPRDIVLKKDARVFVRAENQNFEISDLE